MAKAEYSAAVAILTVPQVALFLLETVLHLCQAVLLGTAIRLPVLLGTVIPEVVHLEAVSEDTDNYHLQHQYSYFGISHFMNFIHRIAEVNTLYSLIDYSMPNS